MHVLISFFFCESALLSAGSISRKSHTIAIEQTGIDEVHHTGPEVVPSNHEVSLS
jgi:hypothetical protein